MFFKANKPGFEDLISKLQYKMDIVEILLEKNEFETNLFRKTILETIESNEASRQETLNSLSLQISSLSDKIKILEENMAENSESQCQNIMTMKNAMMSEFQKKIDKIEESTERIHKSVNSNSRNIADLGKTFKGVCIELLTCYFQNLIQIGKWRKC